MSLGVEQDPAIEQMAVRRSLSQRLRELSNKRVFEEDNPQHVPISKWEERRVVSVIDSLILGTAAQLLGGQRDQPQD